MTEALSVTEAESYLNNIPLWASRKNSLASVRDFLEEMGNPDESVKMIHVAGTNGKGSVCAYLTSMLKEAGYKVGTFISPHLVSIKERFLIDGVPVEDRVFLDAFEGVRQLSETMTKRGYWPPTYFEFLFYMFMAVCQEERPDFVVLETGLGGLLDTTNVIRHPLITVITSISMDHMQYLGRTIPEIAAQKAGIIKEGVPVIYDAGCEESRKVIRETARKLGCPEVPVGEESCRFVSRDREGTIFRLETGTGTLRIRVASQADYQMINGTLAVTAALCLRDRDEAHISDRQIRAGMETCFWPGRMEQVLPGVYLDGAHNMGGMEALTRTIARMQKESGKKVSLMFGVVADKEYHGMIEKLCSRIEISHVTIAHMDTERSVDAGTLAAEFGRRLGCPVEAFDTVKEAWNHFLRTRGEGLAFCAGSLYLVGEVKALLHSRQE